VWVKLSNSDRVAVWKRGSQAGFRDLPLYTYIITFITVYVLSTFGPFIMSNRRTFRNGLVSYEGKGVDETKQYIQELLDANVNQITIAAKIGTTRKPLRNFIKAHKLQTRQLMPQDQLETLISGLKQPLTGHVMMESMVNAMAAQGNMKVGVKRVQATLCAMDPEGVEERKQRKRRRRVYYIKAPGSCWHLDGYHKLAFLVGFGIVIHGCIDGFTRQVVFCRASDNNYKETVKKLFLKAIKIYGVPKKVCMDRGGENNDVIEVMLLLSNGDWRRLKIVPSTLNQRIERLWVDIWANVAYEYRALFEYLVEHCEFEEDNVIHRFCLHHTFLDVINEKIDVFVSGWNGHRMKRPRHYAKHADGRQRRQRFSPDALALLNENISEYRPFNDFPKRIRKRIRREFNDVPESAQAVVESVINPFTIRHEDLPHLFPGGREDLYEILKQVQGCKAEFFDTDEEKVRKFINCLEAVNYLIGVMRNDL